MFDISIGFNQKNFEYDVYTLVKAFYPNANIHSFYIEEEEHPADTKLKLDVGMYDDKIRIYAASDEKSGKAFEPR